VWGLGIALDQPHTRQQKRKCSIAFTKRYAANKNVGIKNVMW
jgi:hypothetical protein